MECDSSDTAGFLYKSCDGMEFERSSNTLDLRFVPDDMEFKNDPRDCAKEVDRFSYYQCTHCYGQYMLQEAIAGLLQHFYFST